MIADDWRTIDPMTSTPGTLFSARYRIDEPIGRGGMSTVYKGFDTTLERWVAIKVMHRDVARDADHYERFRREARAIAKLSSPYVVGVIDAGEDDGQPFIVLEYVPGETLKQRIKSPGAISVTDAVAYAIEVTRGLQAAHDAGIVHRDVKPQNVLLDEDGAARVTDFGIARSLADEGLTADGRVLGTTDYVSPEQALGHAVTPQSDLYSLGIVLFEMLTGRVPYDGENQVAVAMRHVREELPDVQRLRPEVSSALAAVLDRATAKDLEVRHASAAALITDLEDALAIETARAGQVTGEASAVIRTLPRSTRSRVPGGVLHPGRWLAGISLLAVLAVLLAALLTDRTQRGTGTKGASSAAGLTTVSLGQGSAKAYDPIGNDGEHSDTVGNAVDRQPQTTWTTEGYLGGNLGKLGVGVAIDATGVAAKQLEIQSVTTGWSGAVYAALPGPLPAKFDDPAWTPVGTIPAAQRTTRVTLNTRGKPFQWYLVWIHDLGSTNGTLNEKAEIREIFLKR